MLRNRRVRVRARARALCAPLSLLLPLLLAARATAAAAAAAADAAPAPPPSRRLLFAAEMCRHGDRAPLYQFPSDALPASRWPEGPGELTAIGQRAHFELGRRLRARYVDSRFLPPAYTPAQVYVRSTDIDRTLVSAVSQMAGFYPPGTAPNSDVRIRFGQDPLHENEGGLPHLYQPVPVHTEARETDVLLLPGNLCPRHNMLMDWKKRSPELQQVVRDNAQFLETVRKISGFTGPEFSIFDLEHLSDTWTCFHAHSVPLPSDATPDIVGKARNLSNWLLTFGNQGVEVNRMRAGLVLHELDKYMTAALMRDEKKLPTDLAKYAKKFVLFSAHDTTVAATLAALRVFDGVNPPYNSTLIWELFKADDGEVSVRVEYNGKPMILPGCSGEYCPVSAYVASTKERTVHGPLVRDIECMMGWRRYAAMVYHSFSRKGEAQLSNFGIDGGDDRSSFADHGLIFSLVLLSVATIGLAGAVRIRSRYKGYSAAASDPSESTEYMLTGQQSAAERRILM